ncbi:hypothetical protein PITC_051510 [Penicillium italicum]|uniref:Uncharacterized protein n=1 Tax=Penicillium italicum TaxID=40296 RepID=A0A0A2L4G4_PENIT|nr:hypothetical protein PITC_051510 [Penicillium italicum]
MLNTLISHYFLYVHLCLPVINEAELWSMLHDTEAQSSSFSMPFSRAILFVACSVYFNTSILREYTLLSIDLIANLTQVYLIKRCKTIRG